MNVVRSTTSIYKFNHFKILQIQLHTNVCFHIRMHMYFQNNHMHVIPCLRAYGFHLNISVFPYRYTFFTTTVRFYIHIHIHMVPPTCISCSFIHIHISPHLPTYLYTSVFAHPYASSAIFKFCPTYIYVMGDEYAYLRRWTELWKIWKMTAKRIQKDCQMTAKWLPNDCKMTAKGLLQSFSKESSRTLKNEIRADFWDIFLYPCGKFYQSTLWSFSLVQDFGKMS